VDLKVLEPLCNLVAIEDLLTTSVMTGSDFYRGPA
jgi:hypothetical protein